MIHPVSVNDFLTGSPVVPIADVRTPAEFAHGHIPGALNLPLFTNEERVQVGTTYKQIGREAAILLGFELTGNKWADFIRTALEFAPDKKIGLHCWRGGMRSGAMAWALDLYGFEVYLLNGGYKIYRSWVREQFERKYRLQVIGGMTGSGKTRILRQLSDMGQQVIDLELLAQHQGSAYGSLNTLIQPTQEQFENNLGMELSRFKDGDKIWVEDESISIGKRFVPKTFWDQMGQHLMFDLRVSRSQRIANLLSEYGSLDKEFLVECTGRIRKRLGPDRTKRALDAIHDDRMEDFIDVVLAYYDKSYATCLATRSPESLIPVELHGADLADDAAVLLEIIKSSEQTFINNGKYKPGQ